MYDSVDVDNLAPLLRVPLTIVSPSPAMQIISDHVHVGDSYNANALTNGQIIPIGMGEQAH